MKTVRLTTADAIVRYLTAQRTEVDGEVLALFPGVFAIFGHGNVTCLGQALEAARDHFPTWRGQNEQGMALAATAFAKAARRRQIMVATSSIGPGATNMVTAAAVAMANRLPLLLLAGDTFASRVPDPVLQQIERFGDPSTTVNDCFRPVVRYWDRLTRPEQVAHALPHAVHTMLDPADCGPAFIGLPQDVQAEAYDFPVALFEPVVHRLRRPPPDPAEVAEAAGHLSRARRPLLIAGGGVRWSEAEAALAAFAERHALPVAETVAGRTSLPASHPLQAGPIGVTGGRPANTLAAEADLVVAVGTRLGDFTTGSWTVFAEGSAPIVTLNTARFDATKHRARPMVGDAREGLRLLDRAMAGYRSDRSWVERCRHLVTEQQQYLAAIAAPGGHPPTYAQVVGALDRLASPSTYVVAAAGGLPGELANGWRSDTLHSFDTEYGFSCMGYEIAGAWGAKMALPDREVVALVGDGSYLMMNSDLYSSVLSGHKLIVVVCDNGGYAVINRLQVNQGGLPFNNMLDDCRAACGARVDFAAHAAAMGCATEAVTSVAGFEAAFERARAADRTAVIVVGTDPDAWTAGGAFWEVGVPQVSSTPAVRAAHTALEAGKATQRVGW